MAFTEKLAILINANGSAAISEFKKVGAAASTELAKAEGGAARFGAAASKAGLGMMAAGGVIAAGLMKAGKSAQSTAGDVLLLQRYTGGTAQEMSVLAHAAQQTGLDVADLGKALGIASKNMAKGKWDELGIATRDAAGNMRPMTELMAEAAERISGMSNGAEKTALVLELFGRSGASLMPMLNAGAAGMAQWTSETEKFGLVMDEAGLKASKELKAAQRDQDAAWKGLSTTLGTSVLPIMTKLAEAGTAVANSLKSADEATNGASTQIAAVASGGLLAVGALSTLAGMVTKVRLQIQGMQAASAAGGAGMGMLGAKAGIAAAGIAIAVAGIAHWNSLLKESEDNAKSWTTAEANRAKAGGYRAMRDQIQAAQDHVAAIDKEIAGLNGLNPLTKRYEEDLKRQRNAEVEATNPLIERTKRIEELVRTQHMTIEAATKQAEADEENRKAIDETGKSLGDYHDAQVDSIQAYKDLTQATSDAIQRQKDYFGLFTSDEDRMIEWQRALRDVSEAFKENGNQLNWSTGEMNLNTEAGARNWDQLTRTAQVIVDQSTKQAQLSQSTEAGRKKFDEMSGALRGQLLPQFGYNREAVDKLMERLGLTAKDWQASIQVSGVEYAIQQVSHLFNMAVQALDLFNRTGQMNQSSVTPFFDYYANLPSQRTGPAPVPGAAPRAEGAATRGVTVNNYVQGSVIAERDLADTVAKSLATREMALR